MVKFESLVILAVMFAILGLLGIGVGMGSSLKERKIITGKTIIIDNGSYRCKMVNTLKEEQ